MATDGNWNLPYSGNDAQSRYNRLTNDRSNCYYVAAYIRYFQDTWEEEFPSIAERPDILGTLYNIGQRTPKPNPEVNYFGQYVMDIYDIMDGLLTK